MSHERDDNGLRFFCDGPDCTQESVLFVPERPFTSAALHMETLGWTALKRVGAPWRNFCRGCSPEAQRRHDDHKRLERARDRRIQENERDRQRHDESIDA